MPARTEPGVDALPRDRRQAVHDLRNSIAAIRDAARALMQQPANAHDLAEGLALIDRNADRLSQLLDVLVEGTGVDRPAPAHPMPPVRAPVRRVLLVEDDDDVRAAMRSLLRSHGHTVLEAADGRVALALAGASPPDLALVDLGMPGLDGHAFVQTLRSRETSARLFVVAVTGFGSDEEGARALAAGFDRYCVKPVAEATLLEVLGDPRCDAHGAARRG